MSTTQDVATIVNEDARYASRGWAAFASNGGAYVTWNGRVRVVATWIGADAFVVTWEYAAGDWRATQVERDDVAFEVAMTVDALAFA